MDIEKLIEQLNDWNEKYISNLCGDRTIKCEEYCIKDDCLIVKAATALSTLQIENQALRNAANGFRAENEKLRADLNDLKAQWDMYGGEEGITSTFVELEQVKRALAMMWYAYENKDSEFPHEYEIESRRAADKILGPWSECMPKYLRSGPQKED